MSQSKLGFGGNGEEFPILCETCLGDNPFIRMTKDVAGKACKVCDRPFTVYRWQPGPKARFKKTELCITCAKLKNVCQTCVLDLQYGLPVQVRDSALEEHERLNLPKDEVNRQYAIEQMERQLESGSNVALLGPAGSGFGKAPSAASGRMLETLARKEPYYKRNAPHLCSFFARGACNRGSLCPYRHEMPTTGELAKQNIKDRYHGTNDPVARKILRQFEEKKATAMIAPPEDRTITTLWVGNLPEDATEQDVLRLFSKHGQATITLLSAKKCAFVTYQLRSAAEAAMSELFATASLGDQKLRLSWGKKRASAPGAGAATPAYFPPPPAPGTAGPILYPSQDPHNLAAKMPTA